MQELRLTIPMEPPTVNHYVKHTRTGRHYKTALAKEWDKVCALFIQADEVVGNTHEVEYTVFQGKGSRGDVDNYGKCVIDSLVRSGVLRSDATVTDMIARKRRDRENPRTEIVVRAIR